MRIFPKKKHSIHRFISHTYAHNIYDIQPLPFVCIAKKLNPKHEKVSKAATVRSSKRFVIVINRKSNRLQKGTHSTNNATQCQDEKYTLR